MTETTKEKQPIVASQVNGKTIMPTHCSPRPHLLEHEKEPHHPHLKPVVVEPVIITPMNGIHPVPPPVIVPPVYPHGHSAGVYTPAPNYGRGDTPHKGLTDRLKQGHDFSKVLDKRTRENVSKR